MISSVAPTRLSSFDAYLITKIGNRNLNQVDQINQNSENQFNQMYQINQNSNNQVNQISQINRNSHN